MQSRPAASRDDAGGVGVFGKSGIAVLSIVVGTTAGKSLCASANRSRSARCEATAWEMRAHHPPAHATQAERIPNRVCRIYAGSGQFGPIPSKYAKGRPIGPVGTKLHYVVTVERESVAVEVVVAA